MIIKGKDLSPEQRKQVLAAFIYRHLDTTSPTDEAWLEKHAFMFVNDGSRLAHNRRFALPVWWEDIKSCES